MPRPEQSFTDAEFEVVGGPYRAGDRHRARKAWRFTGRYDERGHPLFHNNWLDFTWYAWLISRVALAGIALILAGMAILVPVVLIADRLDAADHREAPSTVAAAP